MYVDVCVDVCGRVWTSVDQCGPLLTWSWLGTLGKVSENQILGSIHAMRGRLGSQSVR